MKDNYFTVDINSIHMSFQTEDGLFSPSGADRGTLAMLSTVTLNSEDKVLDLGCGYGLVGIWAAKQVGTGRVVMCDISEEAVNTAKQNAVNNQVEDIRIIQCDALEGIPDSDFTKILSNPPYHEDFSVAKHFIEQGWKHLAPDGWIIMVTKRRDWYYNKIKAVFGGVRVEEIDGYYVFSAQKRQRKKPVKINQQIMSKKLQRKTKQRRA